MPEIITSGKNLNLENCLASLPGRTILAIFTVMVAAGALPLVFYFFPVKSKAVLSIVLLTTLGLTSGLASRILLRKSTKVLMILTSVVSLSAGMLILGVLTSGLVEFSLINERHVSSNWIGILQFSYGATLAILSILAWAQPTVRNKNRSNKNGIKKERITTQISPSPTNPRQITRFRKLISEIRKKVSLSRKKTKLYAIFEQITIKIRRATSWLSRKLFRSTNQIRLNQYYPSSLTSQEKLKFRKHQDSIRLVGDEVHNCPYCLEPVMKKDTRGHKICPICKTWHHADCWEAGSECQVPHHH